MSSSMDQGCRQVTALKCLVGAAKDLDVLARIAAQYLADKGSFSMQSGISL